MSTEFGPGRRINPARQEAIFDSLGTAIPSWGPGKTFDPAHSSIPAEFHPGQQQAYPFTTEVLSDFMSKIDFTDKTVAAVCGSGDFGINAAMLGARQVDNIDVMTTACMFGEMKQAGLATFSKDDFLDFFGVNDDSVGQGAFDATRFDLISSLMSRQSREYFEQLITPAGASSIASFLIRNVADGAAIQKMNPYLKDAKSYDVATAAAGRQSFYPADMAQFMNDSASHYDVIYLSNIRGFVAQSNFSQYLSAALSRTAPGGKVVEVAFANTKKVRSVKGMLSSLIDQECVDVDFEVCRVPYSSDGHKQIAAIYSSGPEFSQ